MAFIPKKTFLIPAKAGTVLTSGLGTTGVKYIIERQDRRLESVMLHLNVTMASTITATSTTDKLEGVVKKIKVMLSDKAGDSRTVVNAGSATLLHWQSKHDGRLSATQRQCIGQVTAGTYDLWVKVPFQHPLAALPVGYAQSIPLWKKNADGIGLGDDIEITVDLASLSSADFGFSANTFTVNTARLYANMWLIGEAGSAAAKIGYVPSKLVTSDFDPTTATTDYVATLGQDGFLTSIMFETYSSISSATATARGAALTTPATDFYKLIYGSSEIEPLYPAKALQEDHMWEDVVSADISSGDNTSNHVYTVNFWHNHPLAEAYLLNTCPNLYADGKTGDLFKVNPTNSVANSRLRLSYHCFLTTNPNLLAGA